MSDGTAGVLLVSSLAVLFLFPRLRPAAARVLKWGAISLAALFVTCLLSMCFAEVPSLQTATPLHAAVRAKAIGRIAELLPTSDVEAGERTGIGMLVVGRRAPLFAAALEGHAEIIAALQGAGADSNAPSTLGFGVLASRTALDAAADQGHSEAVSTLLEAGADPNAASFFGLGLLLSVMPLHNSASGGHTATVAALLKAGADPNALWP